MVLASRDGGVTGSVTSERLMRGVEMGRVIPNCIGVLEVAGVT
jgi:hypothetical protein